MNTMLILQQPERRVHSLGKKLAVKWALLSVLRKERKNYDIESHQQDYARVNFHVPILPMRPGNTSSKFPWVQDRLIDFYMEKHKMPLQRRVF